jgi:hypothetical protein
MTWIILIVTLGSGPEQYAMIPFRSEIDCGNALPAIHGAIVNEYPDAVAKCVDSGVPKVRPRARPDHFNKD